MRVIFLGESDGQCIGDEVGRFNPSNGTVVALGIKDGENRTG